MWANAKRDGPPAEFRWCPLFNAEMTYNVFSGTLNPTHCSTPQSVANAQYSSAVQ